MSMTHFFFHEPVGPMLRYKLYCVVSTALLFVLLGSTQGTAQGADSGAVVVTEPSFAAEPGTFGIFGGYTFELSTLKTSELDPDIDKSLILTGGYGYVIISQWLIGGGGASVDMEEPNEQYERFTMGYSGLLTGYDKLLARNFSVRTTLLVGGGEVSMIKKRPDLTSFGDNPFLERFREEDFFLLRPEVSVGYTLFSFLDVRLSAGYWYPIGGNDAQDLRQFMFGLHFLSGFRNNIRL